MAARLKNTHARKALERYGKLLVEKAKLNLQQHNVSGELTRSVNYKITTVGNRLQLEISMADYGDVLDKGLSGYKTKRNTKYQAISSRVLGKKGVHGNVVGVDWRDIRRWVGSRGIKFQGQNINSTSFLIHRKIKWKGFRGTRWFTRAKESTENKLKKNLARGMKKDILTQIRTTTRKIR